MISNNDVVLVDENDMPLGTMEKVAAHLGDGKLHRAISVWIIRNKKQVTSNKKQTGDEVEILITKRSDKKMLWPGYWSNTVCSHPKEGESYEEAGKRRLWEEAGVKSEVKLLDKLTYKKKYKQVGTEHETTGILVGEYDGEVKPHPDEIADYKWVSWEELMEWIERERSKFTPWFLMMAEDKNLLINLERRDKI